MEAFEETQEALLELLMADARTLIPGALGMDQTPEEYVAVRYEAMAQRAHHGPLLYSVAWLWLAEHVRARNYTTLRQLYALFTRLQSDELRNVFLVTGGRRLSLWHLKACLYVWLNGAPAGIDATLGALVEMRCFMNMTPREADQRLQINQTLAQAPFLYRLSTTKAGQLTLSYSALQTGTVLHMRLELQDAQRLYAQDDLYAALVRETILRSGDASTQGVTDVVKQLSLLGYRNANELVVVQRLGEPPYASARLPALLRAAFYPGKWTVQVRAQSTAELIGLTPSYAQGYDSAM